MIERRSIRGDLRTLVRDAVANGVDWLQVRDRELEGAALLDHARAVLQAARRGAADRRGGVRVVINRRTDVALAAGADGVHLGFDAIDAERARQLLGPEAWIGVSTHSVGELQSVSGAASYAQLAPIFEPLSKPATRPTLGLASISTGAKASLPLIAQGGIDAGNAAEVIAAGASGVAVTGAILGAADPAEATRALRAALDGVAG